MMCKCNNAQFIALDVIDNAIWETPYRKTAPPLVPLCCEMWMRTKKIKGAFKFGNKCQRERRACLSRVIDRRLSEFSVSLFANGGGH